VENATRANLFETPAALRYREYKVGNIASI
jgi:hypothetical protein